LPSWPVETFFIFALPRPVWPPLFPTRRSSDLVEADIRQAAAFQTAFDDYAADCAQDPDCPLGTDPAKATDVYQSLVEPLVENPADRKSTRLNSSHVKISYAVFCLKKKNLRYGH